jgi:hypothetical protein
MTYDFVIGMEEKYLGLNHFKRGVSSRAIDYDGVIVCRNE